MEDDQPQAPTYRQRLLDEFATEAMKAFLARDQDTMRDIASTRGAGMSTAKLIAGVSYEMAKEMLNARDRIVPPDEEDLDL